jgi:hypothetical protein
MQTALIPGTASTDSESTVIVALTCAVQMRAAPMPSIADIVYSKYTFSINNCAIKPSDIDH